MLTDVIPDHGKTPFALLCFAFEQVGASALLCDQEHRIIHANNIACDNLGYNQDELLGLSLFAIVPSLTPQYIAEVDRLIESRHGHLFEGVNRTRDGRLFPVESSLKAFSFADQRLMLLTNRDLSQYKTTEQALRQTENRLTTLVNTLPDLVWMKDANGVFLACNSAFEAFFGAPESTIIGKTDYDFFSREQADFFRQKDLEAIAAQRICINEEVITDAHDGRSRSLETRKVPVIGADGKLIGVLGIGRDISELQAANIQLRKSRDVLRALAQHHEGKREAERRKLARQVHEDLAQNLAVQRLNITLLAMNATARPFVETLDQMLDITDRCIVRARDIVTMLRPSVLELGIAPALEWLSDVFRDDADFQLDLMLTDNIRVDEATATAIFRATQEILLNTALHAAATHVEVSLIRVNNVCRLRIHDNGRGFDPSAPHADDRFGLIGLSEQILHLDGNFSIHSAPGQGTTVEICLPIQPSSGVQLAHQDHAPH